MNKAEPVVLIGVAGTGMRGLAHLLTEQGYTVWGTDQNQRKMATDKTLRQEIEVFEPTELAKKITSQTTVIYSDAVPSHDPVRQAAAQQQIEQLAYPHAVARLAKGKKIIAVAGTHGKTTTTAFLAHLLIEQQFDPTVIVGAIIPAWRNQNSRFGQGEYFLIEADEYRDHFLAFRPDYLVVTSLGFDHPDFFHDIRDVEKSFSKFLRQTQAGALVVVPKQVKDSHPNVAWPQDTLVVSESLPSTLAPQLIGEHLRFNAALAMVLAQQLGLSHSKMEHSLTTLPAIERRLEELGTWGQALIISDYGHHPTEISVTLTTLRKKFPGRRILALFEAHTLARLETFFQEFINAFTSADALHVVPVFVPTGREKEVLAAAKVQQEFVQQSRQERPTTGQENWQNFSDQLKELAAQTDIIVGFSAGRLDQELRDLITTS